MCPLHEKWRPFLIGLNVLTNKVYKTLWLVSPDQIRVFKHTSSLTPAWKSNHVYNKVKDEITYRFPNFDSATVDVWEWISYFVPHLTRVCDYLSMVELKLNHVVTEVVGRHKTWWTLAQAMARYLTAPSHYLYYLLVRSCSMRPGVNSQEMFTKTIPNMSFIIINLRFLPHLPGASEVSIFIFSTDINH